MFTKQGWKCCDSFDGSSSVVEMPPNFKHFAKSTCKFCGHFLKWLPNPKTAEQMRIYLGQIEFIKEHAQQYLSTYEDTFITDIANRKKLSPKQISYLKSIYDRFEVLKNIKI